LEDFVKITLRIDFCGFASKWSKINFKISIFRRNFENPGFFEKSKIRANFVENANFQTFSIFNSWALLGGSY